VLFTSQLVTGVVGFYSTAQGLGAHLLFFPTLEVIVTTTKMANQGTEVFFDLPRSKGQSSS
jgi:hypothetical protein